MPVAARANDMYPKKLLYKLLSDKYYTHATPTLFNAGTINHTLSSCYLLSVDDSLENIYGRLTDISKISKFSGGVGIHVSQVRAQGSVIASTIGRSEGLVPMLRVFNESTKELLSFFCDNKLFILEVSILLSEILLLLT